MFQLNTMRIYRDLKLNFRTSDLEILVTGSDFRPFHSPTQTPETNLSVIWHFTDE